MLERYALEVIRKRERRKCPRTAEGRRREPAAGNEERTGTSRPARNTSLSVLFTHSRRVPVTGV